MNEAFIAWILLLSVGRPFAWSDPDSSILAVG
jgi:hypothetical protein